MDLVLIIMFKISATFGILGVASLVAAIVFQGHIPEWRDVNVWFRGAVEFCFSLAFILFAITSIITCISLVWTL